MIWRSDEDDDGVWKSSSVAKFRLYLWSPRNIFLKACRWKYLQYFIVKNPHLMGHVKKKPYCTLLKMWVTVGWWINSSSNSFLISDTVPVMQVEADQDEQFGMFATGWSPSLFYSNVTPTPGSCQRRWRGHFAGDCGAPAWLYMPVLEQINWTWWCYLMINTTDLGNPLNMPRGQMGTNVKKQNNLYCLCCIAQVSGYCVSLIWLVLSTQCFQPTFT